MREIVGSGSTATAPPPPPQNQSSGAGAKASTPDTSPEKAWADAVAQAKANSPQQSVTVKRGDTLTSIANGHHDTVQDLETANPQILNPDLLHTGQTVYLPKTTPTQVVTGVDNSQVQPIINAMADANSADQGLLALEHSPVRNRALLQDAQAQSAQSWDTVGQTTLDMLMNNNAGAYPELAAAAEVKQLNALEPGNTKFAAANNAALDEATQNWTQMGVTKPQLGPIIDAHNNVKQTTDAVNQYLQNPHLPHNRVIVDDLRSSEQQANSQLNAAIEKSLTDAANQAGGDPKARSEAMTERAANIQLAGPQDPAFQTAVDNANYDLQVNKPAQAVADAYAKGGAAAAADALKTATQNAGTPYYAGQIIQHSQGTIDSITRDMGSLASDSPTNWTIPGDTGGSKFNQIYADLSQSVEAANTVTTSGTLSPGGKAAADMVANSIAKNVPGNLMWSPSAMWGPPTNAYTVAATNAITNGDGVALTLATAAALQRQGKPDVASSLLSSATQGIQALQSKTKDDVTAFATTTNDLHQFRATWGPFMTEGQLANATNGYLADHPDVQQKANAQLGTISQDGDAIADAESAWHSYSGQLNGINGQRDLSAAAKSLTDDKNVSAQFAVSQSTNVNNAIAATLGPSLPSQGGGGSVVQALLASPVWSLPRSTRSYLNATYKMSDARAKASAAKAGTSADTRSHGTYTTLSVIGLGLTVENAWAKGFPTSSPQQTASSAYMALGFGKYGGEVISGLAKNDIVQKFLSSKPGFTLASGATPDKNKLFLNLSDGSKIDLTNLTKTGWFKTLGSAYYGAGALANVLLTEDDINNGDKWAARFDSAEALGNFLNAAKPLVPRIIGEVGADGAATAAGEAAAELVGAVGSGIGLVAVLGGLIYEGIKSGNEQQAYQNDSFKFLRQGLGLKSDIAHELVAPSGGLPTGGSSTSVSNALQAYASAYHMSPAQLLQKLNQQPTDKAIQFIDEAAAMPTQSNGGYALSLPTDSPSQVGTHLVTVHGAKGGEAKVHVPNQADSLRQLKYWADRLFGQNQLG